MESNEPDYNEMLLQVRDVTVFSYKRSIFVSRFCGNVCLSVYNESHATFHFIPSRWQNAQINTNLSNTLRTWGSSSHQYQTVLQTLKDCLREIDAQRHTHRDRNGRPVPALDPDMLSVAMGFLELGK